MSRSSKAPAGTVRSPSSAEHLARRRPPRGATPAGSRRRPAGRRPSPAPPRRRRPPGQPLPLAAEPPDVAVLVLGVEVGDDVSRPRPDVVSVAHGGRRDARRRPGLPGWSRWPSRPDAGDVVGPGGARSERQPRVVDAGRRSRRGRATASGSPAVDARRRARARRRCRTRRGRRTASTVSDRATAASSSAMTPSSQGAAALLASGEPTTARSRSPS